MTLRLIALSHPCGNETHNNDKQVYGDWGAQDTEPRVRNPAVHTIALGFKIWSPNIWQPKMWGPRLGTPRFRKTDLKPGNPLTRMGHQDVGLQDWGPLGFRTTDLKAGNPLTRMGPKDVRPQDSGHRI